jgi:hypothetical protein
LGSQLFNNNEDLMEGVKTWFISQAADFFDTSIQKHNSPCDRYLSSGGDEVEK